MNVIGKLMMFEKCMTVVSSSVRAIRSQNSLNMIACVLCVFVSFDAEARFRRGRLSSFSVPRRNFFFNSPQRFFAFNRFNNFGSPFASQNNFVNRFNAFGNLGFNRFNQFNQLSLNNNNNLVDIRQTNEIVGFSKIRTQNGNLVEVDQFGIGQKLFIDGNGNLIGGAKAPEARTVQQLKELYLANRDKFKGNAKATVDRFLARQGALSNGIFRIDLDDFALDFDAKEVQETLQNRFGGNKARMRRELGLASLNYLLNSLQGRQQIRIPESAVRPDGTVTVDLSSVFRGEVLALFNQADSTAACNGGTIRLNRLVNFTMNPDNYYKILNVPAELNDVARAFGVQADKTLTFQNKIVVGVDKDGVKESVPAQGSQRILEVQPTGNIPGSSCYRSLDTEDQPPGGEQSRSRSIKDEGILFKQDAEEWLCLAGNGFMQGYLFDGNGKRIAAAPAKIATGGILGPEIKSVVSCLDCHADGFIGGGEYFNNPDKFYTERSGDVKDGPTIFRDNTGRLLNHRDFFTRNPVYKARAEADSEIFRRARINTGSEFLDGKGKPFASLPQIEKGFQSIMRADDVAAELGLGDNEAGEARAKALIGGDFIVRNDFESKFCNLKQGRNDRLNEFQEQQLLQNRQFSDTLNHLGIGR